MTTTPNEPTTADQGRRNFGAALQDARLAAGVSQTELAARAGVTQPAVSGWEGAKFVPEPAQVFALERALGVPPGGLSAHLGYVPVGAGMGPAGDVRGAIMATTALDALDKRALLATYDQLAARPRSGRK